MPTLYTESENRPCAVLLTLCDLQTCFYCGVSLTTDEELSDGVCDRCADLPLPIAVTTPGNCFYCEPGKPATTTVYSRAMQQELAVCTFCAETSSLHGCKDCGGDPENPFSECPTCEATMQARNRATRPLTAFPPIGRRWPRNSETACVTTVPETDDARLTFTLTGQEISR